MTDPTKQTIATYDAHAALYAERNADRSTVLPQLSLFMQMLPAGTVLDVGCGPGMDSADFHAQGYRIRGMDLSAGMLAQARQNAPGVPLAQANMLRLPYPTGHFDGVWSCASMLHLPKAQSPAALDEFRRVLKPGGLLYVCVKDGHDEQVVATPAYDNMTRFFAFYQLDELAALLTEAGLDVVTEVEQPGWINLFARRPADAV